jgi:hypothetical protein
MGFMRWLQRIWFKVRGPFAFLSPLRFIFIPLIALLWTLIASAEGQDAVRALVDFDDQCPRYAGIAGFVAIVILLALQAWYWGRQLLRIDFSEEQADLAAAFKAVPRHRTPRRGLAALCAG